MELFQKGLTIYYNVYLCRPDDMGRKGNVLTDQRLGNQPDWRPQDVDVVLCRTISGLYGPYEKYEDEKEI